MTKSNTLRHWESLETRILLAADADSLLDVFPGPMHAEPGLIASIDGQLIFTAVTQSDGPRQLFRTDGTPEGTVLLEGDLTSVNIWGASGKTAFHVRRSLFDRGQDRGTWRDPAGTVYLLKTEFEFVAPCSFVQHSRYDDFAGRQIQFEAELGSMDCVEPEDWFVLDPKGVIEGSLALGVYSYNYDLGGPVYLANGSQDTWTRLVDRVDPESELYHLADGRPYFALPDPEVQEPPGTLPYPFGAGSLPIGRDRFAFAAEDNPLEITLRRIIAGDANYDGYFASDDLLGLFQVGQYEDNIPGNSIWASGDFNGDQEFDSSDLIEALAIGWYR